MSCTAVQRKLLELPVSEYGTLQAHLDACDACQALAAELIAADRAIGEWVDDFEDASAFDEAWERANTPPGARWAWLQVAVVLLVAGVVGFGGLFALGTWVVMPVSIDDDDVTTETDGLAVVGEPDRAAPPAPAPADPGDAVAMAPPQPMVRPSPVPSLIESSAPRARLDTDRAATRAELATDVICDDVVALEVRAMLGVLTEAQVGCLETRYHLVDGVERDKVSRVLMFNAWSAGARADWERLARRHLDEVDRHDADLAYKIATYLSERGPDPAEDVIRYAEQGLSAKEKWTGDSYTFRVYKLYRLRAEAARDLWVAAETDEQATLWRERTVTYAGEWREFALLMARDVHAPDELCTLANQGESCP